MKRKNRDWYHVRPTKCCCARLRGRGEVECLARCGAVYCNKPKGHRGLHTACCRLHHRFHSWRDLD